MENSISAFRLLFQTPEFKSVLKDSLREVLHEAPPSPDPDDRCNLTEISKFLGVSEGFVYRETHLGTIPHEKFGNRLVFSRKKILEWRNARTVDKQFKDEVVYQELAELANEKLRSK